MRALRLIARSLALTALLVPATLPAQESDDSASRTEALLALVRSIEESQEERHAVLGDLDPRRAGPEGAKIARALRSTRVDLVLEKQDLPSTIDLLGKLSGLNFLITPRARAVMEEKKPQLSISLRGLTMENVIDLLALQLEDYRFAVRYGAVVLMAREEHRPVKVTRLYPVADLVRPRPDFPAPTLALNGLEKK